MQLCCKIIQGCKSHARCFAKPAGVLVEFILCHTPACHEDMHPVPAVVCNGVAYVLDLLAPWQTKWMKYQAISFLQLVEPFGMFLGCCNLEHASHVLEAFCRMQIKPSSIRTSVRHQVTIPRGRRIPSHNVLTQVTWLVRGCPFCTPELNQRFLICQQARKGCRKQEVFSRSLTTDTTGVETPIASSFAKKCFNHEGEQKGMPTIHPLDQCQREHGKMKPPVLPGTKPRWQLRYGPIKAHQTPASIRTKYIPRLDLILVKNQA